MAELKATVCNPLLRTPLSLVVDDSCPVVNLAYHWMKERHAWKARHSPGAPPDKWEGDPGRLESLPRTIPAEFARRWGEWCLEEGVRGKFSLIPCPAGLGRIDRGLSGFPRAALEDWLRVAREVIAPNFDLTPEMLTHTHVVDPASLGLEQWRPTDEWEQVEWVDPPAELLTEYVAAAFRVLKNVGVAAAGVTSPGAFGKRQEDAYARAVLDASCDVNGDPRPFYFLWIKIQEMPDVPIRPGRVDDVVRTTRHADAGEGRAVASVVGCTGDWFGGWTGYDAGSADRFIAPDLASGRLVEVLEKGLPCVLVGHWPGFYFGGEEVGFDVLKEVKRRLDAYDPGRTKTTWMKNSEIGRYWMARELSEITVSSDSVRMTTRFPADGFTLELDGCRARRALVDGVPLERAGSRRDFRSGTFLVEGDRTFAAFDLGAGSSELEILR